MLAQCARCLVGLIMDGKRLISEEEGLCRARGHFGCSRSADVLALKQTREVYAAGL